LKLVVHVSEGNRSLVERLVFDEEQARNELVGASLA